MAEFNVRSDSVNVEQIMEQIRSRIREKRGLDYTEQQIRELAAVKLEKFLDPKGVRSDLLEQFRNVQRTHEPPPPPNYAFEAETLYETHRGPLRFVRRLLNPILKLFFNPNPIVNALHIQSQLNTMDAQREASRRAIDQLNYEMLHNLVIEMTRSGIELKNLKMRVESLSSRLEFNERRMRALESVVVYKTPAEEVADRGRSAAAAPPTTTAAAAAAPADAASAPQQAEGPGQRSRRRRRRRGRRGGAPAAAVMGQQTGDAAASDASGPGGGDEPSADVYVARDDLEQVTGAQSHPAEVTRAAGSAAPQESAPAAQRPADSGPGPGDGGPQQQ